MKLIEKLRTSDVLFRSVVMTLTILFFLAGCRSKTPDPAQPAYPTAAAAGDALQNVARKDDEAAIVKILGPGSADLVYSGDKNEDKATVKDFTAKYDRMHRWTTMSDGRQVLFIGADNYPFPIPLKQDADQQWTFDTAAGKTEILARRIGRNELLAMDACYVIADSQRIYFEHPHDGSTPKYAQLILSTSGKKDGLYWKTTATEQPSPLSYIANLLNVDNASNAMPEFDGYRFRILTSQGANAPGGAQDYVKNGELTGGFAVIASPIKYRDSGVVTFLLGPDGSLFEKDLGPNTAAVTAAIQQYDPDSTWSPAQ